MPPFLATHCFFRASRVSSSTTRSGNVLVIGSGGRAHALGWKMWQSPYVNRLYFAPGNGGTTENNVDIKQNDVGGLVSFAKRQGNNLLTIVGPEEPLSLGIVDAFSKERLRIFGPTRQA